MSYGFQIFNNQGVLELSNSNMASTLMDVILVTKGVNGSRNYPLGNIKYILMPTSGPQYINDNGTSPIDYARCLVSVSGGTVSWSWEPLVHWWAYQSAQIFVFHSD